MRALQALQAPSIRYAGQGWVNLGFGYECHGVVNAARLDYLASVANAHAASTYTPFWRSCLELLGCDFLRNRRIKKYFPMADKAGIAN